MSFSDVMKNLKSKLESGWTFTASLSVPLGAISLYNFKVSSWSNGGIIFTLPTEQQAIYKQEITLNCSLTFQGAHTDGRLISFSFANAKLSGNPAENYYTNQLPNG